MTTDRTTTPNTGGPITRTALAAALGTALLAASGCGTILNGTKQGLSIASDPPGAMATGAGQAVETPGTLVIPRKAVDEMRIRIEKAGFVPCVVRLEPHKNAGFWVDVFWIPVGALAGGALAYNRSGTSGEMFHEAGNAVLGGLAGAAVATLGGVVVDAATGGGNTYRPGKIDVVLEKRPPEGSSSSSFVEVPGGEPDCAPRVPRPANPEGTASVIR